MRALVGRAAAVGGIAAGGWLLGAGIAAAGPGPAADVPARVSMSVSNLSGTAPADENSGTAEAAPTADETRATAENSSTPAAEAPIAETPAAVSTASEAPATEAPATESPATGNTGSDTRAPTADTAGTQVADSANTEPDRPVIAEPHIARPHVRPVRIESPRVTVPEVVIRTNPAGHAPDALEPPVDNEIAGPAPKAEPPRASAGQVDEPPTAPTSNSQHTEHRAQLRAHAPQHVTSISHQRADRESGAAAAAPADRQAPAPAPGHRPPPVPIPAAPATPTPTASAAPSPGIGQGLRALLAVLPDQPRLPGPVRAVRGHFETVVPSGITRIEPSASPD